MKQVLNIALSQIGIKEIVGKEDNPEVLKYFNDIGFDGKKLKDETSWCSAFVNWVCMKAGLKYTKKLNARSWLEIGNEVEDGKQELGDIVVYWRESEDSWKGHVGFYINEIDGWIYTLGGNQSNSVCIMAYPRKRLLKFIRL